jgi:ankyrin repeat protein
MKNSVITLGIVLSIAFSNMTNANVNPTTKNVKITTTTIKDVAPLSIAVAKSDIETVKKFLEFGSDIEIKTEVNGMTPLMYAARYNNVEMVNLLVLNGADVNATSKLGYTALHYAELSGATDVASLLK